MSREGGGHTTQTSHSLEPKDGTDLPIPGSNLLVLFTQAHSPPPAPLQ